MAEDQHYLTTEGEERLKQELKTLTGEGRDELSKRLRSAIQQGDLSENADYTKAKEDQSFLEGRIQELESVLKNVIIIDDLEQSSDEVSIGNRITIQEDSMDPETYFLVGTQEADPRVGKISHESPIGSSLLGHHLGDEISVSTPDGIIQFKIISIE